jgi:hypothetical protein
LSSGCTSHERVSTISLSRTTQIPTSQMELRFCVAVSKSMAMKLSLLIP